MGLFQGNPQVFAEQITDGSYRPIERPMRWKDYQDHLEGEATYGIYPVLPNNLTMLLVWDIDTGNLGHVERLADTLDLFMDEDQYLIEFSGRKGWHLWVFLDDWYSSIAAYRAVRAVLQLAKMEGTEAYPKQPELSPSKPLGNLIKLPLGKHKLGNWSYFTNRANAHLNNQAELADTRPIDGEIFAALVAEYHEPQAIELNVGRPLDRPPDQLPPCMQRVFDNGVEQGSRHDALFGYALECKNRGLDEAAALEETVNAGSRFSPPATEAQAAQRVRSAYQSEFSGVKCSQPYLHREPNPLCSKLCSRYVAIEGMPATDDAPEGSAIRGQRRAGQGEINQGDSLTFEVVLRKSLDDGRIRLLLENDRIPDLVKIELEAYE